MAAAPLPLLQPSDRFALRWNDFPDNVTAIFRQLRRDGQLADVTLMCAGGRQVRAHKVVLSSSSSFFRQFLRDHSQPNPWLFLRGVEAKLLDWLMDFIYLGEVMVTQESFPAFLALARDLGVRGLTGATPAIGKKKQQQEEESTAAPNNNFPSSGYTTQSGFSSQSGYASQSGYTDVAKDGTVEYLADVVKTEPQEEENAARLPDFDLLEDSYDGALVIAEDEDINTLTKEEKVKLRVQQRLLNAERRLMPNATEIDLAEQSEVNAELDRRISDMIVRQDGGWVCTVCGKQANHKSKLKQHAETHLQGYSHPCIMCGKTYRSRNVLRMHMSRDHRSKGHMDQMPKADDAKHYLKMEPIQHQRILPQPQQMPAIQYHESSTILKAPTIKQMVQQTMKQEQHQQQNHIVIDGEQQHQQLQDYKQHQGEEEEDEEEEEEEAGQEGDVVEILGA